MVNSIHCHVLRWEDGEVTGRSLKLKPMVKEGTKMTGKRQVEEECINVWMNEDVLCQRGSLASMPQT